MAFGAKTAAMPDTSTPSYDAHLNMPGHLLRRCHQIGVAIFMRECQAYDLTPLQFVVLSTLADRGSMDHATLAGAAALDRTTVAVVVKNLAERGLLLSQRSENDRRAKIVSITREGCALFDASLPAVHSAQEKILEPLSQEDQRKFLDFLSVLAVENNLLSRAPQATPSKR